MAISGWLFNLDSATLATLLTNYTACLTAIATAGQSYSIGGRTFTRANLNEVAKMIQEIKAAQRSAAGTRVNRTLADFRGAR